MKKIFLDTNIWLRFFTGDNSEQSKACRELFTKIESGKYLPYCSNIVLLEIAYTLKTFYNLTHLQISHYLETLFKTRNLTILEKTNSYEAFKLHKRTKIKFTDCLIATQIKPGMTLLTYDHDFLKLIPDQTKSPSD